MSDPYGDDLGGQLIGGIEARDYWPITHLAALIHHRRTAVATEVHLSVLDCDGFCMHCWREASARYFDEREEITSAGRLFETLYRKADG